MDVELMLAKRYKKYVYDNAIKVDTPLGEERWWLKLSKDMTIFLSKSKPEMSKDSVSKTVNKVISSFARDLILDETVTLPGYIHSTIEYFSNEESTPRIIDFVDILKDTLPSVEIKTAKGRKVKSSSLFNCCGAPESKPK